jgi:hypoxanthine phosphoribosyltransferase
MDPQPRLHPQSPGAETARADHVSAARTSDDPPAFAHASEAELGRILDFYGLAWEYEPRTFPLMWNLSGQVTESFTPDFYLPELDLFLELTTLRQKLVRKKNRKLRRLREVYPEVRIKLLYARDFRALMLKFGRIGLADAFSGAVGQTTPPRARRGVTGSGDPAKAADGAAPSARASRRSAAPRRASSAAARDAATAAVTTATVAVEPDGAAGTGADAARVAGASRRARGPRRTDAQGRA